MDDQKIKERFVLSPQSLHEIRNALNSVLGYAQMLQDEELSNEHKKIVTSIENAAMKIKNLTALESHTQIPDTNFQNLQSKQLKILIADDSDDNREILAVLLKKVGADLFFAANGKEALETVSRQKFDIVFLDFHMPELDGRETAKLIKEKSPDTKVAVVSGDMEVIEQENEKREIFDYHLAKPFRRKNIQYIIADLTQNCVSARQLSSDDAYRLVECAKFGRITCLEEFISSQSDSRVQDFLREKVERFAFEEIVKWIEDGQK